MKHGVVTQLKDPENYFEEVAEIVRLQGFSIFKGFLNSNEVKESSEKIDKIYQKQLKDFNLQDFDSIRDSNIARSLATEDPFFAQVAVNRNAVGVISQLLGEKFILFSQNGIINPAEKKHYQSAWHRDLNYQHWTSSKPIGMSILIAIDAFTVRTGCTRVATASHKQAEAPSDHYLNNYSTPIEMEAGDAAIFDAMLFHKAGENSSGKVRRAINHIYSIPLLRPQFDFTKVEDFDEAGKYSATQKYILGDQINQPLDPYNWRKARLG
jgi:hypothetical protein